MSAAVILERNEVRKPVRSSKLWSLDQRLPLIAARAAVEFDRLVQSVQKKEPSQIVRRLNAIAELSLMLGESMGNVTQSTIKKGFVDPLGLNLFAKAYNKTHSEHQVTTRSALLEAMEQFSKDLKNSTGNLVNDEGSLENMRDFCVALSEYATINRELVYHSRQDHSYRK